MVEKRSMKTNKRLWVFITSAIILPNIIEQLVLRGYSDRFENIVWYNVLHTSMFLLISVPFFVYLLRQSEKYAYKLEYQLSENLKVNEKLEEKTYELSNMAYYDYPTGLPNRHKLYISLEKLIEMSDNGARRIAVLFLYIDQYKIVNNVIGHELDDHFIKHVSEKLSIRVPHGSIVSRYSGNEFLIILRDTNEEEYSETASEIISLFSNPFNFNQNEIFTTASMGISVFPFHGQDADTLIKNADIAMFLTKNNSGSTYRFYSPELVEGNDRAVKLIKGLRSAVNDEQLILHYQPQVDLETGMLRGVEALLRWQHPDLGCIPPDDFIPLAEETGEIISIGKWVLLEACHQAKHWQDTYSAYLDLAVNVSVRQLEEPDFVDVIVDVLHETGLEANYLEIEITESMLRDLDESHAIFSRLKKIGVKLVIDDFGTGYSSLSVLGFLPIDYLKIDRSFTSDMLYQSKINTIVKTIISMGNNLELKLIAEGIEEKAQLTLLKQYGCHVGQGYYFSKPIQAEEIEKKWLKKNFQ